MAFLRVDQQPTGKYLRIVRSKRVNGKTTHEVIYNLGKAEDYSSRELKRFGQRFYELGGGDASELFGGDIEELGRYNYGYAQVYSKVLAYYGLEQTPRRIARKNNLTFDLYSAVLLMLIERLHDPCSKHGNYLNQAEYIGIATMQLHHLYRALDKLADNASLIQQQIFQTGRDLFAGKLDVVFYDVTTFYFESEVQQDGALRQKGFSKDGKIGNTQILFGLLIDRHKQPVGYRIYKGDTFEGHTFTDAITTLKEHYNIDKIIVVADRGMMNQKNLDLTVKDNNYEFIIGERLKNLPRQVQEQLLDLANYKQEWIIPNAEDAVAVRYHTVIYEGKTIIGTYSKTRAEKDKHDRQERISKGQLLLKHPSLLKKKAHHYYLEETTEQTYQVNEDRINKSARFDGFLAISSNATDLSIEEILDNYKHLYQIEHTFRTFKSHLETRPMYHWTDKRIEGHICLCYMAYTLLNHLQNKLAMAGMKRSENQIRKALDSMQLSLVMHQHQEYYLRSNLKDDVGGLLNKIGIKPMPNLMPKSQLAQYL